MAAKFGNKCKKSCSGEDDDDDDRYAVDDDGDDDGDDDDGNKCKQSCSGPGSVTTQAPAASQRMKLLRRLNQKLNFF